MSSQLSICHPNDLNHCIAKVQEGRKEDEPFINAVKNWNKSDCTTPPCHWRTCLQHLSAATAALLHRTVDVSCVATSPHHSVIQALVITHVPQAPRLVAEKKAVLQIHAIAHSPGPAGFLDSTMTQKAQAKVYWLLNKFEKAQKIIAGALLA